MHQIMHVPRPAVFFLLCISLPACQRDGRDARPGENDHPQVLLSEIFRIGDEEAGDTVLFGGIDGLAVNAAGQLFVGDNSSKVISVFSPDGVLMGRFGSRGSGPGEFRSIRSVLVDRNDSIYVFDSARDVLSVFAPEAWAFAGSVQIARNDSAGDPSNVIGITDQGPIVQYQFRINSGNLDQDRFVVTVRTNWAGIVVRTLARLPAEERLFFMSQEGNLTLREVPFARRPTAHFTPSGKLFSGWNETISIAITSADGEALGSILRNHAPIPVTAAELNAIVNPDVFDSIHKVKPAYKTFIVDDKDRVWLKGEIQGETPTAEWLILDASGKVVGRTELPAKVTLRAIRSGRAYGSIQAESIFAPSVIPRVFVYSVDMGHTKPSTTDTP